MKLLDVKSGNVTDYKKTSLYIAFPYCSGKCGDNCQNRMFWQQKNNKNNIPLLDCTEDEIVDYYNRLVTHKAVVMGGLEPLDSLEDLVSLCLKLLGNNKPVDIIIYTGYTKEEFAKIESEFFDILVNMKPSDNVIFKIGRYDISAGEEYYNGTLGIKLATDNQFTRKYYNSYNSKGERSIAIYEEHSIFE